MYQNILGTSARGASGLGGHIMQEAIWAATRDLRRQYDRLWFRDHVARTFLRRDNRYTRRRLEQYDVLVGKALSFGGQRQRVDEVVDIDPADFGERYLDTDTPVVFKGAGKRWEACNWTPESIAERAGETTVRILQASPSQPKAETGTGYDADYKEIAKSMREGGDLYARFSMLFSQFPEFLDDLDLDWFRTMRRDMNRSELWVFFMGGEGTATGLHSSIAPNLFYQITGRKRWYIYPAAAAPFFRPAVNCSPFFYSEIDADRPDEWPIAEVAPGWYTDLDPGDILWIPAFAWHQVHNHTATIAAGYRWQDFRLGWRTSKIQTLLAATCTNPAPWKAATEKDLPKLFDEIGY